MLNKNFNFNKKKKKSSFVHFLYVSNFFVSFENNFN